MTTYICGNCGMTLFDGQFLCPACEQKKHQAQMQRMWRTQQRERKEDQNKAFKAKETTVAANAKNAKTSKSNPKRDISQTIWGALGLVIGILIPHEFTGIFGFQNIVLGIILSFIAYRYYFLMNIIFAICSILYVLYIFLY